MAQANKKVKAEEAAAQDDPTLMQVLKKILRRDTTWTLVRLPQHGFDIAALFSVPGSQALSVQTTMETKVCLQEELQDALLWFKAVVAIITGIVCGFHLDGASGLIAGVAAVIGLSTLFVQYYLRVDDEAYGGLTSLLLDSAYVAFAAFLVRIYAFHFSVLSVQTSQSFHFSCIHSAVAYFGCGRLCIERPSDCAGVVDSDTFCVVWGRTQRGFETSTFHPAPHSTS
jgi:hypothetical protein